MTGLLAALGPVFKAILEAVLPLLPELFRDTMEDSAGDDDLAGRLLERVRD